MKLLMSLLALICALAYSAWQNRIDLVVNVTPLINQWLDPVSPHAISNWQSGPEQAALPPEQRPPNVILIIADDMGFNDISLYNGGAADGSLMTPNIDALAKQGVTFKKGYSANAICAPSRASLLTGRYSTRFGFEYTPIFKLGPKIFQWMEELEPGPMPLIVNQEEAKNVPQIEALGMPSEEITIAEILKSQGYYTAHIGKWHVGNSGDMLPHKQGFDDALNLEGTLYLPENHPDVVNAKIKGDGIDRMVWANGRYAASFNGSEDFKPQGYLTDYYTEEAVKVIEKNRNRPFFLYLSHWSIHNPLQANREDYEALSHIKDHNLRVYAAMIKALDRSVQKVVSTLDKHGLTDNTLIIFTSDNGGASYVNLANINKPYRGWKLNHFEGGIHVPFMAKWPNKINPGSIFNAPIHHVDLFHTIASAAGASLPSDRKLDGVDLLPFIRNEVSGEPHDTLFWRQGYQQTVLHENWKLIRSEPPKDLVNSPKKLFLFNLNNDPTEQINLTEQYPEKVKQLEAMLEEHNAEQADPLWPGIVHTPQRIDKTVQAEFSSDDEYLYWQN
jgi:uncharacterized sulfatase